MRAHLLIVLAIVAIAATTAPAARADAPTGVIKGTVIFEGEPPARVPLVRKSDPKCAQGEHLSEDVVVTHGKLRDALVRVTAGPAAATGVVAAPAAPAIIDQRDCAYAPRVLGVLAGQPLAIRNSDNTFHNVHGMLAGTSLWNTPQPAHAADVTPPHTPAAGEVIELQCDVHPWMHAYAVVADNPFFAVTGDDGTFELTGLPPGKYTIESWHPVLGTRSLQVIVGVGPKGKVNARLSYKARDQ
jgi:hypothetical protein